MISNFRHIFWWTFYEKVAHHPMTIPLNFGGDPDSQFRFRTRNRNVIKSVIERELLVIITCNRYQTTRDLGSRSVSGSGLWVLNMDCLKCLIMLWIIIANNYLSSGKGLLPWWMYALNWVSSSYVYVNHLTILDCHQPFCMPRCFIDNGHLKMIQATTNIGQFLYVKYTFITFV